MAALITAKSTGTPMREKRPPVLGLDERWDGCSFPDRPARVLRDESVVERRGETFLWACRSGSPRGAGVMLCRSASSSFERGLLRGSGILAGWLVFGRSRGSATKVAGTEEGAGCACGA